METSQITVGFQLGKQIYIVRIRFVLIYLMPFLGGDQCIL